MFFLHFLAIDFTVCYTYVEPRMAETSDSPQIIVEDYQPHHSLSTDMSVLKAMWFANIKGDTLSDELDSFYESQAHLYDSFRFRMLHGRFPMAQCLAKVLNEDFGDRNFEEDPLVWVDLGGGTGSNVEFFARCLGKFRKVIVLDLCHSLVVEARKRVDAHTPQEAQEAQEAQEEGAVNWQEIVEVVEGDATRQDTAELQAWMGRVDIVTFSYALTMIPDWKASIGLAKSLLRDNGVIGVCDFTVDGSIQSFQFMKSVWKSIFSIDHVYLNEEHREHLSSEFESSFHYSNLGDFPYLPGFMVSCPYYVFVGRKRAEEEGEENEQKDD